MTTLTIIAILVLIGGLGFIVLWSLTREKIDEEAIFLDTPGALETDGRKLTCPACGHDAFWHRKTLMNTPAMTFFGFDWMNKNADNYICAKCNYIMWFYRRATTGVTLKKDGNLNL